MDYRFIRAAELASIQASLPPELMDQPMLDGHTPLTAASACGRLDVIDFLLASGANPDIGHERGTPLVLACFEGRIRVVKRLLKAGAAVNGTATHGWTPLIAAANAGRHKVLPILIDAGARLDAVDHSGNTALHHACFCSRQTGLDAARILLAHGAHPAIPNRDNLRPYECAIQRQWKWSQEIIREIHKAASSRNPDGSIAR